MGSQSSIHQSEGERNMSRLISGHPSESHGHREPASPLYAVPRHEADMWPHDGGTSEANSAACDKEHILAGGSSLGVSSLAKSSQQPSSSAREVSNATERSNRDKACLPLAHLFRANVRRSESQASTSTRVFDVEVQGLDGVIRSRTSRSFADFERAHTELEHEFAAVEQRPLVSIRDLLCRDGGQSVELQRWLDEVINARLTTRTDSLMQLLGVCRSTILWPAEGACSLTTIAECYQPLLATVVDFLCDSAQDFVAFCGMSSKTINDHSGFANHVLWEQMYRNKWPAFHTCLKHEGVQNWRLMYRDTLGGQVVCRLEVFDREKKLGFAMAAMAADVQYESQTQSYVVNYVSASEVLPETVPVFEQHRLRYCPPSAHARLEPRCLRVACPSAWQQIVPPREREGYPYKVIEGFEGLLVGSGCELQWKMQHGSPFGWWYGHLEQLEFDTDETTAVATITFQHFPTGSRWYRLEVRFGDSQMRTCVFGGFTGGIRGVTEEEHIHWMKFFPKEPVVF